MTVERLMPSPSAIRLFAAPAPAIRMSRARRAMFWGVLGARIQRSRIWRCSGETDRACALVHMPPAYADHPPVVYSFV